MDDRAGMRSQETLLRRDAAAVEAMMQTIRLGGRAELVVTGISMLPFLHPLRDSVILEAPSALLVGDIVFFSRGGGRFILHRIRRILKNGVLVVCGDNQDWTEQVAPEQVLAKAAAVRRSGGRVISCRSAAWRISGALWYPTRPLRPALFSAACRILRKRRN